MKAIIVTLIFLLCVVPKTFASAWTSMDAFVELFNGNPTKSLELINIEINEDSENYMLYNSRAWIYESLQEYDKALADYSYAIKLKIDYATAYYNRANLLRDLGFYETAIVDYTMAIEFGDTDTAYINRGYVYLNKLNNVDKALDDFVTAMASDVSEGAYYGAARCYLEKVFYDFAIDSATKAIELQEENPDAYFIRGKAKILMAKTDSGLYDLQVAITQYRNAQNYDSAQEVQRFYNQHRPVQEYYY